MTRQAYIRVTMQASEIKALRAEAGLTQAEFARAIGADSISVSRWERGVYTPLPVFVRAIEERFGAGNKPATKRPKTRVTR